MAFVFTRDQLYKLAAMSSFGDGTRLMIDPDSQGDNGTVTVAIPIRGVVPDRIKKMKHENGFAYFEVSAKGHETTLSEDEV